MSNKPIIHDGVSLGSKTKISPFCIIGFPVENGENTKTVLGSNCIVRSHTVIYAGNLIGSGFCTGHHVLVREFNKIGENVSVGSGCSIEHHCEIGNFVRLHTGVFIPEYTILHDQCWLGPGVTLTNAKYPCSAGVKKRLKGPVVGKGAKIGASAVILPGVVIGKNAVVGAGAVVTSDLPENTVAVGNPAEIIKKTEDIEFYRQQMDCFEKSEK